MTTNTIPAAVTDKASWVDLTELDRRGEGLTQWEIDFVESLMQQLLEGRKLSDRQASRLEEIREARL